MIYYLFITLSNGIIDVVEIGNAKDNKVTRYHKAFIQIENGQCTLFSDNIEKLRVNLSKAVIK